MPADRADSTLRLAFVEHASHHPAAIGESQTVPEGGFESVDKTQPAGPPAFESILYECGADRPAAALVTPPHYFRDLNLDQIVDAITAGREDYDLKPFFYDRLTTVLTIQYRHEVMRDLEDQNILSCIETFAAGMRVMRAKLVQMNKLYYKYHKERWLVHSVEVYCATIRTLRDAVLRLAVSSRGLLAIRKYLTLYVESERFVQIESAASGLAADLSEVRFSVIVKGNGFTVRKYDGELDYSIEVTDLFAKFRQGDSKNYLIDFKPQVEMDHIEAKVLEFVALLHPEIFSRLDRFCSDSGAVADKVLVDFDREVQFYLAYREYMARIRPGGLTFCYPDIADDLRNVDVEDAFDMALAAKLVPLKQTVVTNDFELAGMERILVVSGPNQGGKTTFARMFGQVHHFAAIGCPVPGRSARLALFDSMFTHFERQENIRSLNGKLQDDLVRIHQILEGATPKSIIILNEIFNSTTLKDAVFLARKVLDRIIELDLLCVCVTFLDELSSLGEKTVSMVSTVVPDAPSARTFKVLRRPADGLSYAISIAEKYALTYERLTSRMAQRSVHELERPRAAG